MLKVLYFTVVPIGTNVSGGAIVCQSHIKSLADDAEIDLCVVAAGVKDAMASNQSFAHALNIKYRHIEIKQKKLSLLERTNYFLHRYPFILEKISRQAINVDSEFLELTREEEPDVIIVDYLISAFFISSTLKTKVPLCVITLNQEADFCRNNYIRNGTNRYSLMLKLAHRRWKILEDKIYKQFCGIVALTKADIPKNCSSKQITTVIPPMLSPSEKRWAHLGNKRIYFIGNIVHYPNKEAINWICTELAPLVTEIDPEVQFRIIGADLDNAPKDWKRQNVKFLGTADDFQAEFEFTHNDLFIAPIANNYGSKIKLLKCIAYGMPFIATKEALSGIEFIDCAYTINLQDPSDSANKLCALINNDYKLELLSTSISKQADQFREQQKGVWSKLMHDIIRQQPSS